MLTCLKQAKKGKSKAGRPRDRAGEDGDKLRDKKPNATAKNRDNHLQVKTKDSLKPK